MASSADLTTTIRTAGPCSCGCSSAGADRAGLASWTGTGEIADPTTGLERTRYFDRQRVGPEDLSQDQRYVADRLRRHNRFLHGWGIACGLVVSRCGSAETDGPDPCLLRVSAGVALDPYGNEVFVPTDVVVDVCHTDGGNGLLCPPAAHPWCAPIETLRTGEPRFLAIRHVEVPVKPVLAPTACSCSDTACEHSRIRDWYELTLLDELPAHHREPCRTSARPCSTVATCPPCPDSGWIVLATLSLTTAGIDDFHAERHRRYLLSLQRYCFECGDDGGGYEPVPRDRFGTATETYVGVAATEPDATVSIPFYRDGTPADAVIAVRAADLAGRTALELKRAWDSVVLFDAAHPGTLGGERAVLTAGALLAHSPLRGDSLIDDIDDLRARVGTPVIDVASYASAVTEVSQILDQAGLDVFRTRGLADMRRLGELDVEALSSVSTANAERLRAVGITTLDDLRRAERLPELTSAAMAAVTRARELLDRLATGTVPRR